MARTFDDDSANSFTIPSIGSGSGSTIAAWYKPASFSGESKLIAQWNNSAGPAGRMFLAVDSSGKVLSCVNYGSGFGMCTTGATAMSTGTWYHLAVTYDTVNLRVYLDGTQDNVSSGGVQALLTGGSVVSYIGRDEVGNPAQGDMGEATIWDTGLEPEEIAAMASGINQLRIRPLSIYGHWPLYGLGAGDEFCFNNGDLTAVENGTVAVPDDHPPVGSPVGANSQYGAP